MRKLWKSLAVLLVVAMVLTSVAVLTASAATPEKLYLTPNANWKQSNARFAAYFFGNGEKWISMTDPDGDGVYEVEVPAGYPNVIFCRMNPSAAANNWNNKWNQTADLTVPTNGTDLYTVKEGTWDKGGGTWTSMNSTCEHEGGEPATCDTPQICTKCGEPIVAALGHDYDAEHNCLRCYGKATFTVAGSGAHLGAEWDPKHTANDMEYDPQTSTYTKVYENVAAGNYLLKCARDHDWGTAYPSSDKAYKVETAGSTVTVTLKGSTVNVIVEAPHTHSYETNVTPPTCTEDGYTTYTCSCGDSYTGNPVTATGHNFVDGICSTCGAADPNYVPPTEPEVTEPEATEPEATEPEATEPEATEPEATEPEATEPEATEPEATEPEATEPEATEPEATEPEATEPDATEPVEKPSVFTSILMAIIAFFKKLLAYFGL